jgi:hypothetical protein
MQARKIIHISLLFNYIDKHNTYAKNVLHVQRVLFSSLKFLFLTYATPIHIYLFTIEVNAESLRIFLVNSSFKLSKLNTNEVAQ